MTKKPNKKKEVQEVKYKDPYSSKEYASKLAFLTMKLSHTKTNFSKLFYALHEVVKSGKQEAVVSLSKIGLETMDARLPRYVLGFIKEGDKYKASQKDKEFDTLILTKKK